MQNPTSFTGTPGKVIALHLNYPSRIAQRGRTPEQPSYFLKPGSSVSTSGTPIERPAGTELLAFEGEIALIIGRSIRRVSPEEGWAAVSGVTAANDFGVYDLRYADKGSNLKSKGGDGFTPLGPTVIDARDLEPDALRVRTWVNGVLVQDDTTADLVFPFGRLVADLSQLMTLEPGDVILTGTPAGSSVVQPGDVVEVEVDAPTAPPAPAAWSRRSSPAQSHWPNSVPAPGSTTCSAPRPGAPPRRPDCRPSRQPSSPTNSRPRSTPSAPPHSAPSCANAA